MNLLRIGNRIVNLDHVVDVIYTPDNSFDDDGIRVSIPSKITLTTNAMQENMVTGYDGEFRGVGQVSETISFDGRAADKAWEWFKRQSTKIEIERT